VTYPLPASYEVCVEQCGARCCKNKHGAFTMTMLEAPRFMAHAERLRRRATIDQLEDGRWVLEFERQSNGKCPMLKGRLCTIYEDRPSACRTFPTEPVKNCLLWPTFPPKDSS
jgi:Fe-S-cluster containining protein